MRSARTAKPWKNTTCQPQTFSLSLSFLFLTHQVFKTTEEFAHIKTLKAEASDQPLPVMALRYLPSRPRVALAACMCLGLLLFPSFLQPF